MMSQRVHFGLLSVVLFFFGAALAGDETTLPRNFEQVSKERALEKGCLSCHEGIEDINAKMVAEDVTCVSCHYGNPVGTTKGEAHKGMIADPGDLRVIDKTCGQCHSAKPKFPVKAVESRGEKGHVERVLKGLIATSAGEISGTRFVWGAQDTPKALYGVRKVKDRDGVVPTENGALPSLRSLPSATNSDADNLLRHECLQCHLWTEGRSEPGYYRGMGCSSCHVLYAESGLAKTGDPTISKTDAGHPVKHEITIAIPTSQCLRCHDSGPGRFIGASFTGEIPLTAGLTDSGRPSSVNYGGDLHFQKGMDCIDCHSSRTIHGDGNIYSKAEEQVAVRCETCHGTLNQYASLTDQKGQRLYHTSKRGREYYLETKVSKVKKRIPQVAQLKEADALPAAMEIPAHLQDIKDRHRLECYACHAQTVTQCYGCHLKRDDRKQAVTDWVSGTKARTKTLSGTWEGKADYIRWGETVIGVNSRGHVSPFVPGGQIVFTRLGRDGRPLALNETSPVPREKGQPGELQFFSFNPIQPHAVTKQARSCESCHNSPKALGLGHEGFGVLSGAAGGTGVTALPFERWVDEQGKMIQSVAHPGSRAFTKEELDRINRLNICLSCHQSATSPQAWKSVLDYFGRATTNKKHKHFIQRIFREGTTER